MLGPGLGHPLSVCTCYGCTGFRFTAVVICSTLENTAHIPFCLMLDTLWESGFPLYFYYVQCFYFTFGPCSFFCAYTFSHGWLSFLLALQFQRCSCMLTYCSFSSASSTANLVFLILLVQGPGFGSWGGAFVSDSRQFSCR